MIIIFYFTKQFLGYVENTHIFWEAEFSRSLQEHQQQWQVSYASGKNQKPVLAASREII